MKEKKDWKKWIGWLIFAIVVILIYRMLDNVNGMVSGMTKLISTLMPFFVGILIACIFYMPCKKFENLYKKIKLKFINKIARGLSVITVYILALLILIMIINIFIPALSKSIVDLTNNLPNYYESAIHFVDDMPEKSIIKKESIKNVINGLKEIDIISMFRVEDISDYIQWVIGVANTLFGIGVSIISSIYILLEKERIFRFVKRLTKAIFKEKTYIAINNYFKKASDIFFKFISSQVLDGLIVGIIASISLSILGVKYWILLGFMIGLFNIIPYFGAILAATIATIITALTGGITQAIWMLVIVIIIQQIDGNIINPKIVGNALKISPILVIFSVTLFGAYFGVLGMFLAVPIMTVIKILVNDFIDYRLKKKA